MSKVLNITVFRLIEPDKNQLFVISNLESWHIVDEYVISPLYDSLKVTPEDSLSRVN